MTVVMGKFKIESGCAYGECGRWDLRLPCSSSKMNKVPKEVLKFFGTGIHWCGGCGHNVSTMAAYHSGGTSENASGCARGHWFILFSVDIRHNNTGIVRAFTGEVPV
ncbi:hypothetical protein L6452_19969 [Arctium lappa]|uniref:Uncharacterized protein n=1 Tax=Arctium lappa TaxID=4217 RepID=A0ACB9BAX7_ARCLA|nr:hypothetical protein L6452_19969 [Arctium lappa]